MIYEESIYNLIPKDQFVAAKQKRYKSQYPPNLAPTASTFGLKTTSKPQCSNLSGKFNLEGGAHSHQAAGGTIGAPKGTLKKDTMNFTKKGTGNAVLVAKKDRKSLNQSKILRLSITKGLNGRLVLLHDTRTVFCSQVKKKSYKSPLSFEAYCSPLTL